jgi:ATP-dependent exoDNAse (exonuclease V) beta subunit
MNLHKAKGLEANVVFLADPLGGAKRRVDVHIERQRGPGRCLSSAGGRRVQIMRRGKCWILSLKMHVSLSFPR